MIRVSVATATATAATAILLPSCGTPKRAWNYQMCRLELTDVLRGKAESEFSVEVVFQFRVRNPNPIAVRLERLQLSVRAGWIDLGVTSLPKKPVVRAQATEIIYVPMAVSTHAAPGSLAAVESPKTEFRFAGTLLQVGLHPETGRDDPVHTAEFPVDFRGMPE